jgi:UDP-glucuronate decarboxylase
MRVLVTGGAGFLGSHLCRKLLSKGYSVVCLDNLLTGSISNLEEELRSPSFEFVNQSVLSLPDMKVDGIFNLACPASPVHYQRNPIETMQTSVLGAIKVLDLAVANKARILQASTSEIYGDPLVSPQSEKYWGNVNPIGIRACYDEGKRAAETLFFDYARTYELPIRVARIFNTYGPGMAQDDGRVVSNFICQALHNKPISIYGNGTQTRSFCYVDDLISGLISLFESDYDSTPINLGNPNPISMTELALEIIKLTGAKSEIIYEKLPPDDPTQREPDITLASEILGWSPKVDRQLGLEKTIDYFREIIQVRS